MLVFASDVEKRTAEQAKLHRLAKKTSVPAATAETSATSATSAAKEQVAVSEAKNPAEQVPDPSFSEKTFF